METLSQFIHRRLGELSRDQDELQSRLRDIETERDQLMRAASAAGIKSDDPPQRTQFYQNNTSETAESRRKIKGLTLKEAAILLMLEKQIPLTTIDILTGINSKYNSEFPRSSLSPQMSRLKGDNLVSLSGQYWELTETGIQFGRSIAQNTPSIFD